MSFKDDGELKLLVTRRTKANTYTAGRMYCDGELLCYTLEDTVREIKGKPVEEWKIKGETAIPEGRYRVILTKSTRFKRILPEVLNVPGYTAVRIHAGNQTKDTDGCILVGMYDGNELDSWLGNSRKAEALVIAKINEAINSGDEVWLTVL
jgi:hypothetical protein